VAGAKAPVPVLRSPRHPWFPPDGCP